VLARELRVGLASGAVTGALAVAVALLLHLDHGVRLAALVGVTLLVNQTLGCLWGAAIPYVMWRLGFDPAQSAAVFTTALTDLSGFLLLLGGAAFLL
jgi:magnesium transporter